MPSLFTIRTATLSDRSLIIEIGERTFRDTFAESNTEADMDLYIKNAFAPKQVEDEINNSDTIFFLVFDKEKIAGYAKVSATKNPEGLIAQHALEIERIYSLKEYIGKQVGKALMEKCLAHASSNHYDVVWLGVWEHNSRAIAFYEKFGFEKFGSHPFLLGNDLQNDFLMKKNLK
jgi:ribosomal protein S18 acetylase RimI-like enzyme